MFLVWVLTVMSVFFYMGASLSPNFDVTASNKAYYSRAIETFDSIENALQSIALQQLDKKLHIYQNNSARYKNFLPVAGVHYVDTFGMLVSDSRALDVYPPSLSVKDAKGKNLFIRIKNLPTVASYQNITLTDLPSVLLMFPGANGKWDVQTDLITHLPLDSETDPLFLDSQGTLLLPSVGDDIYRVVRFNDILERKIGESRAVIRYMVNLLSVYSNQKVFSLLKMCYPATLPDLESWVNPTVPPLGKFFLDGENSPVVYNASVGADPNCATSATISSVHLEAGGY